MLQTQATTRSPAPQTAAPASASGPAASNQAAQEQAGLAAAPPAAGGADLLTTLQTMGPMAAVVLDAMPVQAAYPLAKALRSFGFVRDWLEGLEPADLMSLVAIDPDGLMELVMPTGSSVELRFAESIAIGIGVALEGSFRLERVGAAVKAQYAGLLGGTVGVGAGASLGYEGLDRTGASASAKAQAGVGARAEWTLDPAQVIHADIRILRDLLAGRPPSLDKIATLCVANNPTTLLVSCEVRAAAEAGAAVVNGDAEVMPDGLSASPLTAGVQGMETGTNLAFAIFSGALGQVQSSVKASAGWDDRGALVSLALNKQVAASLFGFDGHVDANIVIEARAGGGAPGGRLRDTIRGTIKQRISTDDDAGSTEMTWKGVDMLDAILATIGGKHLPPGAPGFAPGELVVEREHRIDDPDAIKDLLGGMPAYDGLVRLVAAHAEARYQAAVTVRMGEDTTAGFLGPGAQNVDAARDRQRALAGVILGETYLCDLPVYQLGAYDCATLDEATMTLVVDVGAGLSGEVAAGAKADVSGSVGATYRREHDLTGAVKVSDVSRLLNAK